MHIKTSYLLIHSNNLNFDVLIKIVRIINVNSTFLISAMINHSNQETDMRSGKILKDPIDPGFFSKMFGS